MPDPSQRRDGGTANTDQPQVSRLIICQGRFENAGENISCKPIFKRRYDYLFHGK
jgi:hypothetical protein